MCVSCPRAGFAWELSFFFTFENACMAESRIKADDMFPVARFDLPRGDSVHVVLQQRAFDREKELEVPARAIEFTRQATTRVRLDNFIGFHWRWIPPTGPFIVIDGVGG